MAFSPTDFPNLFIWLDAADGLFKDAAKTQPCTTDGDAVYVWANKVVTAAGDVSQPTLSKRPTLDTTGGQNNKPRVVFDDTAFQALHATHAAISQPITVYLLMKWDGSMNQADALFYGFNAQLHSGLYSGFPTSRAYTYGGIVVVGTANLDTSVQFFVASNNTTNSSLYYNNAVQFSGGNIGSAVGANFSLMGHDDTTNITAGGDVYEVLVYNASFGFLDDYNIKSYFNDKYNLGLNFPPYDFLPSGKAKAGVSGYQKGLKFLGASADLWRTGIRRENTEGNPTPPCLAIDQPNVRRFRWGVLAGTRTISIDTKQVSNVTGKRPRIIVKANPEIGVNADVVGDAGAGTGWTTVGPLTVTPTSDGVLWVELWNMDTDTFQSSAYFDHLVRT